MQPGMAVWSELPVMDKRPCFDGFAVDNVREVSLLAEEIEVGYLGHVRFVPVLA